MRTLDDVRTAWELISNRQREVTMKDLGGLHELVVKVKFEGSWWDEIRVRRPCANETIECAISVAMNQRRKAALPDDSQ